MLRSTLLYLSTSERLKGFLTGFKSFEKVTRRFVAGETLDDAIAAVRSLNSAGVSATLDHLGESVTTESEASAAAQEYLRILDRIRETGIDSNISIKLSQLGLDIDQELCYANTRLVVEGAARNSNFVRIDMEDSARTEGTLGVLKRLRQEFENVGIVIQAYLYRSERDVDELLGLGARIRLCKGAYDEPASVAFPSKADVDHNYVSLMKKLLSSGIYHAIATHDQKMIDATRMFALEGGCSKDGFEFQMLYGIRRALQRQLSEDDYHVRVYVPYGGMWYPYFMRRLAERPANLWFVMKNVLKG